MSVFGMGRIDSISDLTAVIIREVFYSLNQAMEKRENALVILRNGVHAASLATQANPSGEIHEKTVDGEEARKVIEQLKREKAELNNELLALKQKVQETEKADGVSTQGSLSDLPTAQKLETPREKEPAMQPASTLPASASPSLPESKDPRELVKSQFHELQATIKTQYQ